MSSGSGAATVLGEQTVRAKTMNMDHVVAPALETVLPPMRPDIVDETQWLAPTIDALDRAADQMVAQFELDVATWAGRLARSRRDLANASADGPAGLDAVDITGIIADIEAVAEQKALEQSRRRNRVRGLVKQLFSLDPSIGATVRSHFARIDTADRSAIQALLDHAVFFRALRAEHESDHAVSKLTLEDVRQQISMSAA